MALRFLRERQGVNPPRRRFTKEQLYHSKRSSNIDWVRYNTDTERMRIKFLSGATYEYRDVPDTIFHRMERAPSLGRFFWRYIRIHPDKYPYTRVSG